RPAILYALLSS
nr:Chain B, Nuclear receptor subfamily 0 group B member 2 [Homo sapiens]7YXC_R Chain R, SHP NR Box 1 Peptide [Homo sapiens]7YXN_R Chain R, SHP NR Box 1 Peptide [Homo sapiens]7YXN_S Chain S, SHP NR Box 1 Peptide [Homo sapiens]7YXO_B Chain B, SHP NR Box 1 Peptide [Homo sapiens]7YXO_D Chain D, SHP NR Box 1 Peptide [Homo sapiens]7YXO_F Chain F, SHP NR Box 1 Peptide [Homo sapiens]